MDFLYQFLAIVVGLLALFLFNHLWIIKNKAVESPEPPEPPRAWPLIGHLLQLATPQPLFRTLAAMAEKHGPTFIVRFGVHRTLIISSCELAKECFTTNDKALASRPRSASGKYLTYDHAMFGFAPYGTYWREIRKLVMLQLLSNHRLESLKHIRYAEIGNFMKDLHGLWVKNNGNQIKVELNRFFRDLTMNVVLKMVVGKRYFSVVEVGEENTEEVKRIQKTIIEFFKFTVVSAASDAIPFLGWFDLKGVERDMKRTAKEMDLIAESWLKEHQQKRECGEEGDGDEQDFMDVLLSILGEDAQFYGHHRDTVVKATSMAMILAATDTTALTLSWAISLLLNNQQMLKKAQEEIDKHIRKDRIVDEKDIGNITYIHAIIKETLRLYPIAPLLLPHEAIEDCNVGGFRISSGTRVIVNAWKIHRDPNIWENPLEFHPERFLTSHADVDVWGKNFELIPFGSGRRSCPGISFALQTMHMMLARLLHEFELQTPFGEPVDMSEGTGLTIAKEMPLEVLLSPRLSSHLYK
ncbi:cytochrome P450 CYP82D47-like [Macadamia integrifolia]|uniref:cytochrome P450 CYP82D47-like n=1 Tax=Macadamia integrifolia TaxID=60698 RepID=UPI001C4EC520|nr:cytochrome P450 CYP82D47-like [Macadamia integrifolia]